MRAIPRKLLIHTVKRCTEINKDRWGKGELSEEITLERVRMEPSGKVIRDKSGAEVQLAATLFYDCKNSYPEDITFYLDDIIMFNGQKFQVRDIEPLYDERKLHHYELGLIKYV